MKLGVFTVLLGAQPLRQACEYLAKSGVQAVEIGCGGNPGKAHCDPKALLADPAKLAEFKAALADNGLELAALSVHGNGVHPDPAVAKAAHDDFLDACRLAEASSKTSGRYPSSISRRAPKSPAGPEPTTAPSVR